MDKSVRPPATQLLLDFLKENNLNFFVRRQTVRFMDDNGMVVEPPQVVISYRDEVKTTEKPQAEPEKKEANG